MTPSLNTDHPSPAYHCGRLLALFDSLQKTALGDVGAGVVQRFYGGALTNPGAVFGQLTRLSMAHLSKLDGGLAHHLEAEIADVHSRIRGYPVALDQTEQGLFALGFWHQIACNNKRMSENSAAKKAKKLENESNSEENL